MSTEFTPFAAIIGGLLIGLASAALLVLNGRIAGISGIFDGVFFPRGGETAWRWMFLAGLVIGGGAYAMVAGGDVAALASDRSTAIIVVAGLLVGFGTKMSNGCTSGHGVCGNARLSKRSIVATLVFIGVGAAVVAVLGGAA